MTWRLTNWRTLPTLRPAEVAIVTGLGLAKVRRLLSRGDLRRARVRGREKVPKGKRSRRVPMSPRLHRVLHGLAQTRMRREGGWSDPGYVFLSPRGLPLQERNVNRCFYRLRKWLVKEKVRPLRLHDARHTFASLALEAGRWPV